MATGAEVHEAALIGQIDELLERPSPDCVREVDDRALGCRDRDASPDGDVARIERDTPVDPDTRSRLRPESPGTVTWIKPPPVRLRSQAAAALAWLSTAALPAANTAARQRPSTVRTRWPTA